jgi:signal transduction histidine kinase
MVIDEPLAGSPPAHDPKFPRILLVEDETTVLETIKGILELDGYAVTATAHGELALDLLRKQQFEVMLTDLRLGDGVDGLQLIAELRQQAHTTVPILLTGYASADSAIAALREGAYDYLVKPCDVVELRTTVARGLEKSRLQAQLRAKIRDLENANETIRALNLELEGRVEQATAELREQIAARDEFMATVSHDLKSPLTFIKGMANLRRRRAIRTPETEPLIDALDQLEACAGRMAQQLDELVDATRLDSGRTLELRREPIDLVALARKAIGEHQQTTDRHVLHLVSESDELVGNWDGVRLGRVLDNLLGNAIKYSPRGGAIEIAIGLAGVDDQPMAVLRVADRGEGIPASDLPHIFERFHRGRNVTGRIPGTGIGLAGVRRIVELHDGSIAAESQLGEGSIFTVRLPLSNSLSS